MRLEGRAASRAAYRILVGNPEGRLPLGRPKHKWKIILNWIFKMSFWKTWTGFIWLRTGRNGELLWTRWLIFWFHKTQGIFWSAKKLTVSEQALYSVYLVSHISRYICGWFPIVCRTDCICPRPRYFVCIGSLRYNLSPFKEINVTFSRPLQLATKIEIISSSLWAFKQAEHNPRKFMSRLQALQSSN